MPSRSWETYVVVLLSGFMALLIPLFLSLLSRAARVRESRRLAPQFQYRPSRDRASTNISALGQRINIRYFLAINAALALIALVLLLVPLVSVVRGQGLPGTGIQAGAAILSLALFTGVGLLYAGRKGDLSWLSPSLRRKERS